MAEETSIRSYRSYGLLIERKANCYCFHVDIALYFEKSYKLIRMHKIALSTLKSAFDFNNKLYENGTPFKKVNNS